MIRRLCIAILALMVPFMSCNAQVTVDDINEIKLSGKYFTAEATDANIDIAKNTAFGYLMENLANYCEEMELDEVCEGKVKANLQHKSVSRGDAVMVLVYIPKTVVQNNDASVTNPVITNPVVTNPSITYSGTTNWPDVINKVCEVDTFTRLQFLLDKAVDNQQIHSWGKYNNMPNQNACYLIMMNMDRQIVGVLSPVNSSGTRTNVKTGAMVDSEGMKSFTNCAPICVRIK